MALRSSVRLLSHQQRSLLFRHAPALRANSVIVESSRAASSSTHLPVNVGVMFVPQQEAWVVERMGKYHTILEPGLNFLIPIIDKIKYVQSLKEIAIDIPQQSAITKDNVAINIDGVLYLRIMEPYKASYGMETVTQDWQKAMEHTSIDHEKLFWRLKHDKRNDYRNVVKKLFPEKYKKYSDLDFKKTSHKDQKEKVIAKIHEHLFSSSHPRALALVMTFTVLREWKCHFNGLDNAVTNRKQAKQIDQVYADAAF